MKYLLAIAGMVALFSAATLPAEACVVCPTSTVHVEDAAAPPQCALPQTRTQHPGWYHDGGYCEGASTSTDVTGSTHSDCSAIES